MGIRENIARPPHDIFYNSLCVLNALLRRLFVRSQNGHKKNVSLNNQNVYNCQLIHEKAHQQQALHEEKYSSILIYIRLARLAHIKYEHIHRSRVRPTGSIFIEEISHCKLSF